MSTSSTPVYDVDLFTDEAIAEPFEHYRVLRDLGPVVWLEAHDIYALARYADVRAALHDDETFISKYGVALNDAQNKILEDGTLLTSDGALHNQLRKIVAHPLAPRGLRDFRPGVEEVSRELVDHALERKTFDAVEFLAQAMPMRVVPELLGWEEEVRPRLLEWGSASFDCIGPVNARTKAALPAVNELVEYTNVVAEERRVAPGSLSAKVLEAADRGEVSKERCPALMFDYLGPSLDTTASALSGAFYLFSRHPDQWEIIRNDPSLIPNAFNEVVRWQSPLRMFTRVTSREADVDGYTIPAGARVAVIFASANHDERFWDEPENFDVTRENASQHVGFGHGVHGCAGQGLTRLEAHSLIAELVKRVARFEPAGEATLEPNNIIRTYGSVPVSVVPA